MSDRIEALVGNLFVVGGRSISTPPPGARVQVAPRRAQRIRENDTLFVLVTPAGYSQASADFYEKLAKLAVNSYFESRVGVTGALRESVKMLHTSIQEYNRKQATDYRAAVLLMAKRGDEVFIVRSGTTLLVARLAQSYVTFPSDPEMLNILPLGAQSEPVAEYAHFKFQPDDLFILGDAGIASLSDTVLRDVIGSGDIEAVLAKLESVTERQASASLIQFVLADSNDKSSLPTPIKAEEKKPDILPAEATLAPEATPTTSMLAPQKETPSLPSIPPAEAAAVSISAPQPVSGLGSEQPAMPVQAPPEMTPPVPAPPSTEKSAAAPAATSHEKQRKIETTPPETKRPSSLAGGMLISVLLLLSGFFASVARSANALLARVLPEGEGENQKEAIPINVAALIAVIVPAIVGVVVVGLALSNRDNTTFEQLRQDALDSAEKARIANAGGDLPTACDLWEIALKDARRAVNEFPDDREILSLAAEAQNNIDLCDRVAPINLSKLRDFASNADLRGPVLAPDRQTLYTLDRRRGEVYKDEIRYTGTTPALQQGETPILWQSMPILNYRVRNIIDIDWMTNGGAVRSNSLVAMDANGLLISYSPTYQAEALQLARPPDWNDPIAIATWRRNFYVLDRGANQIWRFTPTDNLYTTLAEEYFTGTNRPDLSTAVDMGIDDAGAIYILFNDGVIQKFIGGNPEVFDLDRAPVEGILDGRALFVDNNPVSYALYVADRGNEALYQISQGGRVNAGYRPREAVFDRLNGVYVDSSTSVVNVYILSGNSLFFFTRTQ